MILFGGRGVADIGRETRVRDDGVAFPNVDQAAGGQTPSRPKRARSYIFPAFRRPGKVGNRIRGRTSAYIVLIGTLAVTGLAWYYVTSGIAAREKADFNSSVELTQRSFDRRIDTYVNAMLDARALFMIDESVTRADWRIFVANSDLEHRYPGVRALGYAPKVLASQKDAFAMHIRDDGTPDFMIRSDQEGAEYFPVLFIEPFDASNKLLLGYDLHSEAEYSDAMDQARDTGMPQASGKVTLASQGGEPAQVGFVMYVPMYNKTQPTNTLAERRAALRGFIVSVFSTDQLAEAIFGQYQSNQIDFEVYDGSQIGRETLLHDHDTVIHAGDSNYHPRFNRTETLQVAGRTWSLYYTAPPNFDEDYDALLPLFVVLSGLAISLFLFMNIWMLSSSRALAERVGAGLVTANRELEAFSYSVSHDLRAPLRSIDGFSLALLEDYEGQLDAQGQDYLRRVRAASQRMAQLIDAMLDLSRVSRQELRRDRVDLSALAMEVAAELQATQPGRAVEWVVVPGMWAQGDGKLVRVVLENLLGNAWKFTRDTPSPQIEVGEELREGQSVYYVRDNGAGFDMAYADKLFGAFQRLHRAEEYEGTGIGLATVQRIVHRHGGWVWAEGAPGSGASFIFTLGNRGVESDDE